MEDVQERLDEAKLYCKECNSEVAPQILGNRVLLICIECGWKTSRKK